jgi:M6 family metalloprotease-like protein
MNTIAPLFRLSYRSLLCIALLLTGCTKELPPAPLGPDSLTYLGVTKNQNKFDAYNTPQCPGDNLDAGTPWEQKPYKQAGDPPLNVFAVIVDTTDFPYTGNAAQLTAYRNARLMNYETNTRDFWKEASYDTVQIDWEMPDRVLNMSGTFDDYFNRSFVAARLTTRGLAGAFPLMLDGTASATIHVRDSHDRNIDVTFAPNATYADIGALVIDCQTTFNNSPSVPSPWVTCSNSGGELRMQLTNLEVKEGSFIRVKAGTSLATLGLNGPDEKPGDGATQASLRGLAVTYPLALTGTETVTFEVRDKDRKTRRFPITMAAGNVNDKTALTAVILPTLNTEFNWVESFNAGANKLGLRIKAGFNGDDAAVRIVSGTNHDTMGLQGPARIDGVVTEGGTNTVRGSRAATVGEALSKHIAAEAAAGGIAISNANSAALDALVTAELGNKDSYVVLFIDSMTGIPGKRAGAGSGPYDIRIDGGGGYTYQNQVNAALQIGTGAEPWETWAHELGHNLGMWDIYAQPWHDVNFDRSWDYLKIWSMMNDHWGKNHADAWHKYKAGWLPAASVVNIGKPAATQTETEKFTLVPLEYPASDYAGVGNATYPERQLARIELSPQHWLLVENRQPAVSYSQNLPDDNTGRSIPAAGADQGGLLITDTVDPGSDFHYRSAVTTLNPHGTPPAPAGGWIAAIGIENGDTLDPNTTYPAYDGTEVRVVGTVAGPAGKPEALRVEVERGPGDHLDLRIRPWDAPNVYGTNDIWIDWPGDGQEDYSGMNPPLGNGDDTHWHPDGSVTNKIRVRVHNDGTIVAKDVVIRAYINEPMGMGDKGNFVPFPNSAPQDIPAGGFTDFAFDWNPKQKGHTCIRAEIFSHASALSELDLSNNAAQENVNNFHPTSGSPYKPVTFEFKVNNDFPTPIEVEFRPSGLPPGMKLELERDWVELAPDEERTLKGRLFVDVAVIPPQPARRRKCNYRFNIHAFIRTQDYMLPFGGITIETTPTKASEIMLRKSYRTENEKGVPAVEVTGRLKGDWPDNQQIDAAIVSSVDGVTYSGSATTNNAGDFTITVNGLPIGDGKLMLYYFGPNLAPSTLGPLAIKL